MTPDRSHTVQRRPQKPRRELRKGVRISGRFEYPSGRWRVVGTQQVKLCEHGRRSFAVSSALDTNVTGSPIASWISPDSSG